MSSSGVEAIDRSMHKTYAWIGDLASELGSEDRRQAYRVLRGVLHVLRDRVPGEEGAHLAAQLPHFPRGVFYEGWKPSASPQTFRSRAELLERLALAGPTEASLVLEACGRVLRRHVGDGEVRDVLDNLPDELRASPPG